MIKTNIQTLFATEMDRKKFLAYTGTVLLGVFGITGVLKVLTQAHHTPSHDQKSYPVQTSGYGGSVYGQ